MIIANKKFLKNIPIYVAYIVLIMCFIKALEVEILIQIFTDKVFVYLMIPPFICGIALIEESFKKTSIVRLLNRKQALLWNLKQQYLFGCAYLLTWFGVIALFALINRETVPIFIFAGDFLRYLLCLILFINISACMRRMNQKFFVRIPIVITYGILVIDILTITSMTGRIGIPVYLIFSWAFYENCILSIVVLIILCGLSYLYLRKLDCKADYY